MPSSKSSHEFKAFKVLSFDCYGTIIDWEAGILQTLKPILQGNSCSLSDTEILERYGEFEAAIESGSYQNYSEVLMQVLSRFGERYGFIPSSNQLKAFSSAVRDWPPFADSAAALKELQKHFKLAILSNIDDELFEFSRVKLGIKFDYLFTAQQIGSYKPAMRNFEFLLQQIGNPKEQLLHVAQSLYHDILPAQKLGISNVWINRRRGQEGAGATPPTDVVPQYEFPDLKSLAFAAAR